jgi:hemoglobin
MSRSLYERLGGSDRIRAITNDTVDLHLVNPLISPRFLGADVGKLKQLAYEFFCMGSGGPQAYTGRDMRAAHAGTSVSEQEFLAVVDDVVAAMDRNSVGPAEKGDVITTLDSTKGDIIRV